jgi:hypothetical protein
MQDLLAWDIAALARLANAAGLARDGRPGLLMMVDIDLGTTNSLAAVWQDGSRVSSQTRTALC